MDENRPFSRRQFLLMAGTLLAGTGLARACRLLGRRTDQAHQPRLTRQATEPVDAPTTAPQATERPLPASPIPTATSVATPTPSPTATPLPAAPGVVHVRDSDATKWDFATGWYSDYVDQDVVYQMVDQGVMHLTGTTTRAAAWEALMPNYVPAQRVAIKVNLNNAGSEGDSDNIIDALIQPVNAVIRGLMEIGVTESDIWVYDAVRWIPNRFRNGCDFSGLQFSGAWGTNAQGFSATERVSFEPRPGGPSLVDQRISNVLASADYLINMPIMKKHGIAYVTLSFKNHFGSIENPAALHDYVEPSSSVYTPEYNPMVDIYKNRHFVGKTVLTIGDGLYGCRPHNYAEPEPWVTFSNQAPNSLFFSKDPVAMDCVMYDFLEAELGVQSGADDYLMLAAQEGLGVFEHRASGASGPEEWYSLIDYVCLDLNQSVKLAAWSRDGRAYLS